MKWLTFFVFVFSSVLLSAQSATPIDTATYAARTQLSEQYQESYDIFNKEVKKKYSGKQRKQLLEIYEFSQEEFLKNIRKKELLLDDRITNYLSRLQQKISKNLTEKSLSPYTLRASRSNDPNAFCMYDGTIVVHAGLFDLVETEAELLSIICHEISHNELNHSEKSVVARVKINTSDAMKDEVKKLRKKKEGRNKEAFSMLKDILYSQGEKRRFHEKQADSLGMVLFLALKQEPRAFLKTLHLLKEEDSIPRINLKKELYAEMFDLPELPFDEAWMNQEDYSAYNYDLYKEKIAKDSIKSHPELNDRIETLIHAFNIDNNEQITSNENTTSEFNAIKTLLKQESIHNLFVIKQHGAAIYNALDMLQKNPDDVYIKNWLGKNFKALHEAKKSYTFNKYVSHVNPEIEDESYRQFLAFMWNLRLQELEAFANYFTAN